MFGEYKLIAYGIIGLLLIGMGVTAVLSYNHYIAKAVQQAETIKQQQEQLDARDQVINAQMQRQAEIKQYQQEADQRRVATENRLKQILSMRSKRDETGNIAADDPMLGALNGMYPNSKDVPNTVAGHPPGTAMPEKPDAAGTVAGRQDILPQ